MALITYTNKDDTQPESDPRKKWTDDDANEVKTVVNTNRGDSDSSLSTLTSNLSSHTSNTSNPHSVSKTQVGLGNADNTSDVNKPVSTAQQTAIDAKVADAINNGTTAIAPSQNAVFDALALKQDALVSATNIKTVNGNSIVGSGDIDLIDDAIVNGETKAPSQNAVFDALALKASTTYVDAKVANTITEGVTTIAPAQDVVFDALALKANSEDIPLLTSFVDDETPSGTMNDINVTFTLANTPISGTVKLYWNGMRMKVGVGFTISTATLTMAIAPSSGDTLAADYRK